MLPSLVPSAAAIIGLFWRLALTLQEIFLERIFLERITNWDTAHLPSFKCIMGCGKQLN